MNKPKFIRNKFYCKACGDETGLCQCDAPSIIEPVYEPMRQEGGDHYLRLPIQPWEIIERCNLDFFEGNVIKYILRRKEDRLTDLKKARHYLDHLIEREEFLQEKR